MDPLERQILSALGELRPRAPSLPLYSTVEGRRVTDAIHDAGYWWRNVRQPVLFADAVSAAIAAGARHFIEVGPHPVLANAIKEVAGIAEVLVVPSLRRGAPEKRTLFESVGHLVEHGHEPAWRALMPGAAYVPLFRSIHGSDDDTGKKRPRRINRGSATGTTHCSGCERPTRRARARRS